MKKLISLILLSTFGFTVSAQVNDTLNNKLDIDNRTVNIYFGSGIQKRVYYEIGLARARFTGARGNVAHWGYFSCYERTIGNKTIHPVNGIKVGGYFAGIGGAITTEFKYQWFQEKHDWIITPKYGFGLAGIVTLSYGFNISLNERPFEQIGKHQFSIIFNLPFHGKSGLKR